MSGQGLSPFQSTWTKGRRSNRRTALASKPIMPFTDQAQSAVFADWFFGPFGYVKAWTGTAWVACKAWTGTAWVFAKAWTGTAWK